MDRVTLTRAQVWKARFVGGLIGVMAYGLVCLALYGFARLSPVSPVSLRPVFVFAFVVGAPLVIWMFAQRGPQIVEGWRQGSARRREPRMRDPAGERAAWAPMRTLVLGCAVWLVVMVVMGWWVLQGWVAPKPPIERVAVASVILMLVALWPWLAARRLGTMLEARQNKQT